MHLGVATTFKMHQLIAFLLLTLLAGPTAASSLSQGDKSDYAQHPDTALTAKCSLTLKGQGDSDTGGISAANMSCTGGPVNVSVEYVYGRGVETPLYVSPSLKSKFVGVTWDESCYITGEQQQPPSCMLLICGAKDQDLELGDLLITDIGVPPSLQELRTDRGASHLVPEAASVAQGAPQAVPNPEDAPTAIPPAAAAAAAGKRHLLAAAAAGPPVPAPKATLPARAAAAGGPGIEVETAPAAIPAVVSTAGPKAVPAFQPVRGPTAPPVPAMEPKSGPIVVAAAGPKAEPNPAPMTEPATGPVPPPPTWAPPRALLCISGPASFHVTIRRAHVTNNAFTGIALYGGAKVTVTDGSTFRNNTVTAPGGGLAAYGNSDVTVTGGSIFEDNTAWNSQGAGLDAAFNATVTIAGGTVFRNNSCRAAITSLSSGGGVHAGMYAQFHITNTSFLNNSAGNGGGAIWGSDWSTIRIGIGTMFANNSASSPGSDVKMEPESHLSMADGLAITPRNSSVLWLKTQDCARGQVLANGYCQWCQRNTYSFDPMQECRPCPDHANCTGADELVPLPGFWRSSTYSNQIHSCPRPEACKNENMVQECVAGQEGNLCGSCSTGYSWSGPFSCGKCLQYSKAVAAYIFGVLCVLLVIYFSVSSTLLDNLCPERSVCASDLMKLLVRHLQYMAVVGALRIKWGPALSAIFEVANWIFQVANTGGVVSVDCILPESGSFPPAVRRSIVHLLAPVGILLAVLFARLLLRGVLPLVRRAVHAWNRRQQQQQGQRSGPMSPALGMRAPKQRAKLKYELSVALLVTLFTFYPWLVRVGLSFFACYTIDVAPPSDPYAQYLMAVAENGWWIFDIEQKCFEGWHKSYAVALGVPCVVVFCCVVPLAVASLLLLGRKKLNDKGFREAFGFLYRDYEQSGLRYMWEVVNMFQMIVIVAVSVYSYTLGAYYSMVVLSLCFAVFCGMQLWWKPFQEGRLHTTSIASLLCMYMTTMIALTMFQFERGVQLSRAYQAYMSAAGVVGLSANVVFIVWCCYNIIMHSRGPIMRFMKKVSEGAESCWYGMTRRRQQQSKGAATGALVTAV